MVKTVEAPVRGAGGMDPSPTAPTQRTRGLRKQIEPRGAVDTYSVSLVSLKVPQRLDFTAPYKLYGNECSRNARRARPSAVSLVVNRYCLPSVTAGQHAHGGGRHRLRSPGRRPAAASLGPAWHARLALCHLPKSPLSTISLRAAKRGSLVESTLNWRGLRHRQ